MAQTLGDFEELTLMSILHLNNETYGVPLRLKMEEIAHRPVSVGALYVTLDRLEDKGLITSYRSEPTPERGGRSKRFVSVTGEGITVLKQLDAARANLRVGLSLGVPVTGGAA